MYPFAWETTAIKLLSGGKCFTHTVRRPTHDQLFEYERLLQIEVKVDRLPATPEQRQWIISKSPKLSEADRAAAAYLYDGILVKAEGYDRDVPGEDKLTVIKTLYNRRIDVEDGAGADGEIRVIEKVSTDGGRFTIVHEMRRSVGDGVWNAVPRWTTNATPDNKRGGWRIKTVSTLRPKMDIYKHCIVRTEGAKGPVSLVDPLIQRRVVTVFLRTLARSHAPMGFVPSVK